jgi:hypothetical protein
LDQPAIEIGVGYFAAFKTTNGPSSDIQGDRHHSFALAGMTLEVHPSTDHPEGFCFGHDGFSLEF